VIETAQPERARLFLDLHRGPRILLLANAWDAASAYRQAGADCLFVPGVTDVPTIERLVRAIEGPLNVLTGAQSPPLSKRLGVARVSLGSGPIRATLGLLRRITRELQDGGTYRALTEGALSYQEANELFERS
jgi:2-methylisocitrate lyase-like PEP mutase family enzyme